MKKISLFLGVLFLDLTAFLISSTCVSLSWFNKGFNINFDNQTGKSLANYFASGDGTKDKPYTITESIHFYNFAWLQYLGEFNKEVTDVKTGKTKIDQKYFKLGSNVNMNGLVVPPVGTSEYAFVGNFDGGEYVVNNLTVSNNFDDFSGKHPSVVTKADFDKKNINILGAFGVVGNDEVNNPDKKSKYNLTENGITSPINCLKNLYLDNVTIKSTSNQLLIGIIAGYVNGCIENCGVHYSKLEIANGTQYISGNQTLNLNLNINTYINENISNYALLGAYNKKSYYWDGEPGSGGSGNDFGGSIDVYNLYRRIDAINNRTDTIGADTKVLGFYTYSNQNFNLLDVSNLKTNKNKEHWENNEKQTKYKDLYDDGNATSLNSGTILPLNVDLEKVDSYAKDSTILSETVLPNNTGYIVGDGGDKTSSGSIKIQGVKESSLPSGVNLDKFFTKIDNKIISKSTIAFSYWDSSDSSTKRIIDDDNKDNFSDSTSIKASSLKRYKDVKKDILELLENNKSVDNGKFASPLLFFNKTTDLISPESVVTLKKAQIGNGEPKSNYQMYKGGINFTLTQQGYLSFVMPTIRNTSNTEIFDLIKVERNSKNEIIQKSKKEELVNLAPKTGGKLEANSVYYCEIPLDEGDYYLGAINSTSVPYFMYLDIGASGSSTTTDPKKPLKNVDFVDAVSEGENKKLNKVDPNNLSKVTFRISGNFDNKYFYYFRRKEDFVYYFSHIYNEPDVPTFNFIEPSKTGNKDHAATLECLTKAENN